MTNLSAFANGLEKQLKDNIESFWNEASLFASVRLIDMGNDEYHTAYIQKPQKIKNKFVASDSKGIYIWKCKDAVLYVGKTDAPSTSIYSRQRSHMSSFEKPWTDSESSGRKYREYLVENNLDFLDIEISYIDTSEFNIKGIAELIESATIDFFKPVLNSEVMGIGKRTSNEYVDKTKNLV